VILPQELWSKASTILLGVCGCWCTHTGATFHVYTLLFWGLEGVLMFCWHMQWVKIHCDPNPCTLIQRFYHTPRGVVMLVYPHWCDSSCLHCLSVVCRECWYFVDTCNGWRSIVILPHVLWSKASTIFLGLCGCWCIRTGATVHIYTAFLGFVGCVDLLLTHAMGEAPLWYYSRYFDPKLLPYS
jgi:hypothetical protein